MAVGLVLFALLFTVVMLRRGRHSHDDYREFPYQGLYSKDQTDSLNLYGRHSVNHLYPDRDEEDAWNYRSKAS